MCSFAGYSCVCLRDKVRAEYRLQHLHNCPVHNPIGKIWQVADFALFASVNDIENMILGRCERTAHQHFPDFHTVPQHVAVHLLHLGVFRFPFPCIVVSLHKVVDVDYFFKKFAVSCHRLLCSFSERSTAAYQHGVEILMFCRAAGQ